MEDRHFLSEPRPIAGLELPTWDVDILRHGVDQPIWTLRIDRTVLPPRRRKKKVVWKLPDEDDGEGDGDGSGALPKFGREDKTRIFEIFKQHKKAVKREKRKSQTTTTEGNDDLPSENFAALEEKGKNGGSNPVGVESVPLPPPPPGLGKLSLNGTAPLPTKPVAAARMTKPNGDTTLSNSNGGTNAVFNASSAPRPPPPPPVMSSQPTTGAPRPPPSRSATRPTPTPPPPGLDPTPTPTLLHRPPPPPPPASSSMMTPPPPPPRRVVPPMRQFQLPSPPPTVDIAHVVTQSYYTLLTRGHIHQLHGYYAPGSTKSLTVGGAHAICHSPADVILQLKSLVGLVVHIRGVLQQSTSLTGHRSPDVAAANSWLVVITGMCVHPHALPFCHSLLLVPTISTMTNQLVPGYQIQNDALCFLTTDLPPTPAVPAAATTMGDRPSNVP